VLVHVLVLVLACRVRVPWIWLWCCCYCCSGPGPGPGPGPAPAGPGKRAGSLADFPRVDSFKGCWSARVNAEACSKFCVFLRFHVPCHFVLFLPSRRPLTRAPPNNQSASTVLYHPCPCTLLHCTYCITVHYCKPPPICKDRLRDHSCSSLLTFIRLSSALQRCAWVNVQPSPCVQLSDGLLLSLHAFFVCCLIDIFHLFASPSKRLARPMSSDTRPVRPQLSGRCSSDVVVAYLCTIVFLLF
jgi:hypothetical protein